MTCFQAPVAWLTPALPRPPENNRLAHFALFQKRFALPGRIALADSGRFGEIRVVVAGDPRQCENLASWCTWIRARETCTLEGTDNAQGFAMAAEKQKACYVIMILLI